MALRTPGGDEVAEDDPRLPSPRQTEFLRQQADVLAARLSQVTGADLGPLVDVEARVDALVSLLVPPEGAMRVLYEHRVQQARHDLLVRVAKMVEEAKRPKLIVPQVAVR